MYVCHWHWGDREWQARKRGIGKVRAVGTAWRGLTGKVASRTDVNKWRVGALHLWREALVGRWVWG